MTQGTLITYDDTKQFRSSCGSISALFTQNNDTQYEVLLEISSHKFLMTLETDLQSIESMQIITSKSFMEISKKSLYLIKAVLQMLLYTRQK